MTVPVRESSVLDAVRGLNWPARYKARNALPGAHPSTTRGSSAEFVEYRLYRQGDDPGRIDWKLLGRTDRVFVRLSPERAIMPTMVVLDASISMAFPAPGHDKWLAASRITLGLCAVARHGGDPAGLVVVRGDDLTVVAPRTRRTVLEEITRALAAAPAGSSALAGAVGIALRRASRVVVVSDFLGDADAQVDQLKQQGQGREIHAVHIVAREELDPGSGNRLVADPEDPDLRRPMPASARAEYQRRFAAWREELARSWRGARATYNQVVTGAEPLRQSIRRITVVDGAAGRQR